ncbi:MAG: hypothetical protein WCJ95_06145 [Mariniphaga sp.]
MRTLSGLSIIKSKVLQKPIKVKRNMKKYLANEKKYYKIKKNDEEHLAKGGAKNESLEES